jgi:hypothetical protein
VVSDRGALPDVVEGDASAGGGGLVRQVPSWMTADGARLPAAAEIEPWFDAVCSLWDDERRYASVAARGRAIAEARYSESVSRATHVGYFTSLARRGTPFECNPPA